MRTRSRPRRCRWTIAAAFVAVLPLGVSAQAAERSDVAVEVRVENPAGAPSAPVSFSLREARAGRELAWTRWMLADDLALLAPTGLTTSTADSGRGLASLRGEAWEIVPRVSVGAISALGALVGTGIPMMGVWRDGRLRQRHRLRPYFRSRGAVLTWRVEW